MLIKLFRPNNIYKRIKVSLETRHTKKNLKCYQATTTREKDVLHRHIFRTATTSKMESLMTTVNCEELFTIIAQCSILDACGSPEQVVVPKTIQLNLVLSVACLQSFPISKTVFEGYLWVSSFIKQLHACLDAVKINSHNYSFRIPVAEFCLVKTLPKEESTMSILKSSLYCK